MPKVKKQRVFKKSVPYAPPYIPAVSGFANTGEGPAPNFVAQDPDKRNTYVDPLFIKGKKRYVNPVVKKFADPKSFGEALGDQLVETGLQVLPMLPFLLL